MVEERKPVFLSHASANAEIVVQIAEYLESQNIPCWYAPRDIPKGDHYYMRIIEDIEHKVGPVVVFITEEVKNSKFVPKEIDRALFYDKTIIPVLVDGQSIPKSLELFLCDFQWIDLESEGVEQLAQTLEDIYQGKITKGMKGVAKENLSEPVIIKNQSNVLLYKVNEQHLHKVQEIYEPFPKFAESKRTLESEQYVYLYHPEHTGKHTSAIALFQSLGVEEVYEWSKEITFRDLIQHPLKRNVGFILEIEDLEFFRSFSYHEFEDYLESLVEKNSYLCMISKVKSTLPYFEHTSLEVNSPKDSVSLLKKYTQWTERDPAMRAAILEWLDINEIGELLTHSIPPYQVKNFVGKIKALISGEMDDLHFRESLFSNVKLRVKNWFKEHSASLKDIAFYLSIGLNEGQTISVIREQARALTKILHEELGYALQQADLHQPRDEYLALFHAECRQSTLSTDIGWDTKDQVYFIFSEDAFYVWEYVWKQMDELQGPILQWLEMGMGSRERKIELFVHLAKSDFTMMREKVIQPLAKSTETKERWLAATILEKLAQEGEHEHKVYNLVKAWLGLRNNPRLQWTAVALLGGELGAQYFPQSLDLLKAAYLSNPKPLYYPVLKSMQQLSQLALISKKYEELYFAFWYRWFGESDEVEPSVLRFAHAVFLQHPSLFYRTGPERMEFWFSFFNELYARPTQNSLLEKLARAALGRDDYERKLSELIDMINEFGDEDSQDRMELFLERELDRIDSPLFLNEYM